MATKSPITIERLESALAKLDLIEDADMTPIRIRLQGELTMLLAKEDRASRRAAIPSRTVADRPSYAPLGLA